MVIIRVVATDNASHATSRTITAVALSTLTAKSNLGMEGGLMARRDTWRRVDELEREVMALKEWKATIEDQCNDEPDVMSEVPLDIWRKYRLPMIPYSRKRR